MSKRPLGLLALPLLFVAAATVSAADPEITLQKAGPRTASRLQPAAGGKLVSSDKKLEVAVAPDALAKPTRVTIQGVVGHKDKRIASPTYELGPHGSTFSKPVELCFTLTNPPSDTSAACLGYFDESTKSWKCEDECLESKGGGVVCGTTNHFTNFAILLSSGGSSKCDAENVQPTDPNTPANEAQETAPSSKQSQ